ncbi:DUF2169 domain-containing protein [Rhizobium lusitanum]|uniref:DUF2169 family type VI secretion system accessory protein n=1 Tax=Rhizobium lusitanum TaxID=293958 RepID=UPI001956E9F5|nr:DUF2169 domain-containing protein [Rhizobium lusitanum]MBM7046359.1 DUF2169 domain-containing protein [Rhizobium lusitanum]
MWQVDNRTPFAALGYFVRDRRGMENWVVAVRARFDIQEGGLNAVADDQGEIRITPDYADDENLELAAEADISPFRPKVDFLLAGNVTALDGRAVNQMEAGFDLGTYTKRALVFGPRRLRKKSGRLQLEGYESYRESRLSWRNSLGGADFMNADSPANDVNPIGMGWTSEWRTLPDATEISLPLVENPKALIDEGALPTPYGFGAIQPSWAPRAEHAGTYDEDWRKYEAPLLPQDFSDRFFQAAPEDQIFDLKGGETGRVIGLHEGGDYPFRLPQIIMECTTWTGGEKTESRPRLVSVLLNGSRKTVEMVWNTAIPCPAGDMSISGCRVHIRQMAGVVR